MSGQWRKWAGLGLLLALPLGLVLWGVAGGPPSSGGPDADSQSSSAGERAAVGDGLTGETGPSKARPPSDAVAIVEGGPPTLDTERRRRAIESSNKRAEQARVDRLASNLAFLEGKAVEAEKEGRTEYAEALRKRAKSMEPLAAR